MSFQQMQQILVSCGYGYGIICEVEGQQARIVWAGKSMQQAREEFTEIVERLQIKGARFYIREL